MLLARSHPVLPPAGEACPLVLDDVWFDHDGVEALRGVSLTVDAGAVTAVAGANGSGKSTLLALLAGLLVPRRGTVVLPRERSTALVVQRSEVSDRMPLTVRDAVAMGRWADAGLLRRLRPEDRQIIDECIGLVGLDGHQGRPLGALSGGQRQRAFLAQGLARRADVLLLDEPTTGLDAATRSVVADVLVAERARGATVVCVSHDDVALGVADRLVVLDAGRVVPGSP
ncbi:ATP-binding cassette domain-containing protein [Arthrobacter sp. NamB2]|uniref:zinc ABC transporter ATP-binding protein AztA n=1 Tax=Arthrobacter sp. NamB2 TaxID=2576035 RepID=UPI0010C9DA9A|nr:zinc ABC transporter ATP-binding protein AztA [Arthrobacter sp. NamB2]TKV29064.1 ATP-binding cassette domain-containing protein [Arthrobacter sp. NamB2]